MDMATAALSGTPVPGLYPEEELILGIFTGTFLAYYVLTFLALAIVSLVISWRLMARGGCHGWAVLIPIYNVYCYHKAIFGRGWLFLLYLVPLVNVILALITPFAMARAYGRSTLFFGLGLLFFPFLFLLILAFSEDRYCGPNM